MRRVILIAILVLAVLTVAVTGTAWYLLGNENFLKSQVSGIVLKQTGRELTIDGVFQLDIGRQTRIEAESIRFENAEWAEEPDMVSVGRLAVTIDIPSLWGETPFIPFISIEDCKVILTKNEAGEANWDLFPSPVPEIQPPLTPQLPPAPETLPVMLEDALLKNCQLHFDTPERAQPLLAEAEEISLQILEGVRVQGRGSGKINGEELSFSGWYSPRGAFVLGGPLEHDLKFSLGDISLESSGTLEDAVSFTGANLNAHFQGPDIGLVLKQYALPPISEGPFDFKVRLDTKGQMTELDIDGDLGNMLIDASGELDRLNRPQSGRVRLAIEGPNLEALGEAIGRTGLVPEPYTLRGELNFDNGIVKADTLVLQTNEDRVEVSGVLGRAPVFADSDLVITATSSDAGRWRGRVGLPTRIIGPLKLDGRLSSDPSGLFSAQARLAYVDSTFSVNGTLGKVEGVLEPDLEFTLESIDAEALASTLDLDRFPAVPASAKGRVRLADSMVLMQSVNASLGDHQATIDGQINPVKPFIGSTLDIRLDSPNAAELGALFNQDMLPAAPLIVQGSISRPDQRIVLQGVELNLAEHQARIEGHLTPEDKFSGSEIEVYLDSPDIADLALLFGRDGPPHEAVKLTAVLQPAGKGLTFRVNDSNLGEINLELDGRIADLENPLGLDANFNISLPSLETLAFLLPDKPLPKDPFTARGSLINQQGTTQLDNVGLTLGKIKASVDGDIGHDQNFKLAIKASGPDASMLEGLLGQELQPAPFSLGTRLEGTAKEFELTGIDVRLGKSEVHGDLKLGLGEVKKISGKLDSTYLDLSWWKTEEAVEEPPQEETPSEWVFDDTPVLQIADYGIEADLDISVTDLYLGNTVVKDIVLGVTLAPNQLELSPISLRGVTGGAISGEFSMDDRGSEPKLHYDMQANQLRLGLMAAEGQDPTTYPLVDIEMVLDGTGHTRREMASQMNGKIRLYLSSGQIASAGVGLIFSDFLTELFTLLNPFAKSSEYTVLDCGVTAANIVSGQVEIFPVVYNTRELTIISKGTLDLDTEKLNLAFDTKPRTGVGLSAGVLVNPFIKVGGRLASPAITLDPQRAAVSSGLAVATVGISLLAKSMSDRFLSSSDPCGDARKEIEKRDNP